jgi:hypothetical protein
MPQPHEQKLHEVVNSWISESLNCWAAARAEGMSIRVLRASPAQLPAAVRNQSLLETRAVSEIGLAEQLPPIAAEFMPCSYRFELIVRHSLPSRIALNTNLFSTYGQRD